MYATDEDLADRLVDYIDAEGDAFEEILKGAIAYAKDSADGYTEDGAWVDGTPYESCVKWATEDYIAAQTDAHNDAGDHAYHLSIDA